MFKESCLFPSPRHLPRVPRFPQPSQELQESLEFGSRVAAIVHVQVQKAGEIMFDLEGTVPVQYWE